MSTPYQQQAYTQAPGTSVIDQFAFYPRDPTSNDTQYKFKGKKWLNTQTYAVWLLVDFTSSTGLLQAVWIPFSGGGSGPVITLSDTADTKTHADNTGNIKLNGSAGIIITTDAPNHTIDFSTPGGGAPIEGIIVDDTTAPGVSPVTPDISGDITVSGAAVANHSVPLETHSRALNSYNIEVQYATSAASTNATKSGVAHFNSSQFTVDGNGFVALSGGGIALDSLGVQATSGSGTNPVLPDGTGKIEIQGALELAGTNPIRSVSTASNTLQIQAQTSQALAAQDATKVGLSNFDSSSFSVSSAGFVTATLTQSTGSLTPGIKFGGATTGITYSSQSGTYYKIGNVVFINMLFGLTNKGSATGNASMTGFPFPAAIGTQMTIYIAAATVNVDANTYDIAANLDAGTTEANLFFSITGTPTSGPAMNQADFLNNTACRVVGFYYV